MGNENDHHSPTLFLGVLKDSTGVIIVQPDLNVAAFQKKFGRVVNPVAICIAVTFKIALPVK